jgi:hypothetical protein
MIEIQRLCSLAIELHQGQQINFCTNRPNI